MWVTGLTAGAASTEEKPLTLSLQPLPSNPLAEAACTAAGTTQTLQLPVLVEPSTAPTSIVLMLGEDIIPVVTFSCFFVFVRCYLQGRPYACDLA